MKISLRAARVNREMTLDDACALIGVSRRTLWNWEHGKTVPNMLEMQRISEVYQTPMNAISLPNVSN